MMNPVYKLINRLAASQLVLVGVTCSALAGEPPVAAALQKPAAATWAGFYAGGNFSWAWGQTDWNSTAVGDSTNSAGSVSRFNGYNLSTGTGSYLMGLQAGYNVMAAPGVLIGVQADATAPNLVGGTARLSSATAGASTLDVRQEWSGTVRGRIGFFHNSWLFYGTGGWAWSLDRLQRAQDGLSNLPGGSLPGDEQRSRIFHSGWVAGGGVELPVGTGWTAAVEYLYSDLGRQTALFQNGGQRVTTDLVEHSLRVGLNYHLGTATDEQGTAGPILAPSPRWSNWALHGQTTYVHQYAVPFREPYRGTNSLIPRQSRETWDATAYIGYKPWQGGEFWFNPEIVQGFGLSNTLGLAGFASGEAYKIGAAYPYARVPRFFLRQTIDLGGQSEDVEGGANQFAGKRTADRLVLTIGKFSAADIFDDNKFAHDPRVDFLNWAALDTGTWDYAADAWGYTYGVAAEYVKGNWTFSAGVFDLPRFPNSTALDTTFSQYQVLGEIERRHQVWGQPGKFGLTAS